MENAIFSRQIDKITFHTTNQLKYSDFLIKSQHFCVNFTDLQILHTTNNIKKSTFA